MSDANDIRPLARAALEMIEEGAVVGLGSGHAAAAFVEALAARVRAGFRVQGVPTSQATAELATRLGIPLVGFNEVEQVDVTVDGADEVDPRLDLIKGLGGALVREKIIATASRRLVIVVGKEKIVSTLGEHGVLPVEVIPFGIKWCSRRLADLGYPPWLRHEGGEPFVSDNGNYVLDCRVPPLADPAGVEQSLRAIPGVVGTGLFLGMAHTVLVQDGDRIEVRRQEESLGVRS